MVTWMQHPQHGKHPAQGHEIETMQSNGWQIVLPKADIPFINLPVEVTRIKIPSRALPPHPQDTKRRPGRPPKDK